MKIVLGLLALSNLLSQWSDVEAVGFNLAPKSENASFFNTKPLKETPRNVKDDLMPSIEQRTFTDYFHGGHKYATVATDKKTGDVVDCMLIGDREFIAYMVGDKSVQWSGPVLELVGDLPSIPIINVTTEKIDEYIAGCDRTDEKNGTKATFQKFLSALRQGPQTILKYAVIFPGTKWCGAGDVARSYDDLGSMQTTDKCCRDHDHALDSLARGQEKHGLKNNLLYTMTKCNFDEQFHQCLYDAGSLHAGAVGTSYFNILKTKCFDKRKKARCAKRLIAGITPCSEYEYDEKSPETWQIFDATAFVPNSSLPVQKLNELLHSAPGLGDLVTLVS